ncbi:MAG: chorismate-binding protein [Microbacteriaceae bacterium]|nr:chorismate-binding protein [Microbacteriaceae bacterium]
MVTSAPRPHLCAVTRPLRAVPSLLQYADQRNPLLWVRGDRGCVGIGEALRLTFRGPNRFAEADAAWREISTLATIDDTVQRPGTGLLAFGTFAFDDRSAAESVLIVPRLLVARHGNVAWVTEVSRAQLDQPRPLPEPHPRGTWSGAVLDTSAPNDAYLDGVREATARIDRGEAEKIVLARTVTSSIDAHDDLRVPLSRLAYRYTDCWTYAVDGMLGASPETLVRQTAGKITSRVLAGTRGRRDDEAADLRTRDELLANEKEQQEHAFSVQSVVAALHPLVAELRTSEQPFALQLPNVWHLATDVKATPADGGTSLKLTAALHPTAAVAGTPTAAAVEAITELEPFDRERYAGATGWIDANGDGEWVIALRGAQVRGAVDGRREVVAYAGGGILAGSDPAHELRETVSKFKPIAEAFAQ